MPEVADLRVKIGLDGEKEVSRGLQSVNKEIDSFGSSAGKVGGAIGSTAAQFAAMGAVVGGVVVAGVGKAVSIFSDFEHGMSAVKAASGATAGEMAQLSASAIALGQDTQLAGIGATDAATAMAELAKGGVSVAQQLGGATKGALLLASSGAISVGEAAGIATKAMNIFGLSGADVAHVADLLSAGANKSATDVGQLGAAFNQSAAVAKSAGLNIETLTGTLAFLAQRGMEGSDAGTSLKTALLALQAPTAVASKTMEELGINVRDSQGHMLPFADIADVLKSRLSGLSDAQRDAALKTIFGNDAIRVGIALYEGGGSAIRDWTANVNDAGSAARTGATLNDNLAGSIDQLGANVQTAAIQIGGKFAPVVRTAADEVGKFVSALADNKDVAKFFDDMAKSATTGLNAIIAKVKDPAFQKEIKQWAITARDVGKALLDLGGAVKDTLGPPLKAAADWFGSLDDQGRKNVIMFGLVAGAAIKFRDELGTLKTVVNDVIKVFADKAAAKAALQKANEGLAGSAGKTATAFGGVRAAAAAAAPVLADVAIVVGGSVAAAAAVTLGFAALANAMDQTGQRQRDTAAAWSASSIAMEHGATVQNDAASGFIRLRMELGNTSTNVVDLAQQWNAYVDGVVRATGGTQGLTYAFLGTTAVMPPFSAALQAAGFELGNAGNKGAGFNTTITGLSTSAKELASSMTVVAPAVSAADQALGAVVLSSQNAGIGLGTAALSMGAVVNAIGPVTGYSVSASAALSDLNTFGNSAAQGLNAAASAAMGASIALAGADKAIQGLGSTAGTLQGYLRPLQAAWDELNKATDNGKNVSATQRAEYERLAPAIQYLNGQIGVNKDQTVAATLAAIDNYKGVQNTGTAYLAAAAHAGASAGATAAAGKAASVAAGDFNNLTGKVNAVPTSVTTTASTNAAKIAGEIAGINIIVGMVPKSFTITANVDISGALASIETLRNNMPHSPAKEGPFRVLPDWATVFDTFEPAIQNAVALVEKFGAAFKGVELDLAKKASETASSVAGAVKGAVDALKALSGLDLAKNTPSAGQFGAVIGFVANTTAMIEEVARQFSEKGLEAAGKFADAASKVVGLIGNGVAALTALVKFVPPATANIYAFGKSLRALVNDFAVLSEQVTQGMADEAAVFAESVGKVVAVIGNGVSGFTALIAYVAPPVAAIYAFGKTLRAVVNDFAVLSEQITADMYAEAASFAEGAGKVVGMIGSGVAAFLALATYADPGAAAIYAFGKTLRAVVNDLALVAEQVTQDAADAAAKFATSAGSVVGVFGNAISGFTSLLTFVAPSRAAIDNLANAIFETVRRIAELASSMSADGIKSAGDFGTAAGTVLGALKTGLDVFTGLAKLVVPSAKAIDDFGIAVAYTVAKIGSLADQIGKDGIERATKFGQSVQAIFGSLKSSMDILTNLAKFKDVATKAFESLAAGLVGAVEQAQGMVNQSKDLVLLAEEYAANMKKAATLFAQGQSLGGDGKEIGRRLGEGVASGARTALDSHSPSQVMAAIGRDVVAGLVQGMSATQQDAAKQAADVASAVAKAITDTLGAATALGKLDIATLPGAAQIGGILAFTRALVAEMAASATMLNEDGLKATSAYADAAQKVAQAISASVDSLAKLVGYGQVGRIAIDNFGSDLRIAVNDLIFLSQEIGAGLATEAASWSEQVVKAVAAYGVGVDALNKLRDYARVGSDSIYAFGKDLMLAVGDLAAQVDILGQDLANKAGTFGEQVGKATGGIATAVAGLAALRDYVRVPAAALYGFGKDLMALMGDFAAIVDLVGVELIQKSGTLGEALGKVFGSVSAAVQGFRDIATFQGVADTALDAFSAGVRGMIDRFAQIAATISTKGVDAASVLGEALSKVFGGLNSATSFFKSLDNILLPDQAGIDRILAPILATVGAVAALGRSLDPGTIAAALAGADVIGKVMGSIQAGNRALVPVASGGGGGGGGQTIIYNFTFTGNVTGFDAFEDQVVSALEDARRRGRIS